jgi:hypothetical protein
MANQQLIGRTFVDLADTLVDSYDLIDFLHLLTERCTELLDVNEAGVVLADPAGGLRVLASSSERMRTMELFEVQTNDGPCLDAWHSAAAVIAHDVGAVVGRWPHFTPVALDAGFASVYALPMRLRANCIGALNVFSNTTNGLSDDDVALGQALADVASIGIINERYVREQEAVTDQLHTALNSRIILEQAKGVIAAEAGIDMDAAFDLLRNYARRTNRPLTEVATEVANRQLTAETLRAHGRRPPE